MIQVKWCEWLDIINPSFLPLIENKDRYLIMYGGRGSSKSDFAAKKIIFRCLSEKYFRCVLVRNTYSSLKDSSYQTIKDIIYDLGLQNLFEFKMQPLEIHCVNGNYIIARGCDDTSKLKSVKDISSCWYEEDIPTENDFITITTSIRTQKASYLQEIFTINPEVEGHYQDSWFWNRFFKDKLEKTFSDVVTIQIDAETKADLTYSVHHSTYLDNHWLPNEFIAFLKNLKQSNPYYYTIYCLGEWGNRMAGGLFYKLFDRAKNTDLTIAYNPNLALHISFDFNVNPYMSCSIWQINGRVAYCVDEIATVSPNNTTKGVCNEFKRKYLSHSSGLFIYGDPSGRNEDTRSEAGHNDYKIIVQELSQYKPVLRLDNIHPSVTARGNFINTIFANGFNGVNILISDKCKHLINDLLFLKEASDGTKHKEKQKDKESGITSEKYGHFSDCFIGETLIQTSMGEKRIDEIKVGDLVLTRNGFKKVLKTWDKGIKPVKTYYIGKKQLTCTNEHKIYSEEYGFRSICLLTNWITFCIFEENKIWKKKLFITTEKPLLDTQIQQQEQKGCTSKATEKKTVKQLMLGFMFINGLKSMGKFLMDIASIIKTKTLLIMKLKTSNVYQEININQTICNAPKENKKQSNPLQNLLDPKPLSGMGRKKGGSGIGKMGLIILKLKKSLALNVNQYVKLNILKEQKKTCIVQENVKADIEQELIGLQGNGTNKGFASFVLKVLLFIGGRNKKLVQNRAEKVYDIMVEDEHEFFANGILAHNCMDYFLCKAFATEFKQYQFGSDPTVSTFGKNEINQRVKY
jgi:phage terminase large subunit